MWNYRIVQIVEDEMEFVEIAEVFYDSENVPYSYGEATVWGDKIEELAEQLNLMKLALQKPVLHFPKDFTGDIHK